LNPFKKNLPQTLFIIFVILVTITFFGLIQEFFLGIFWALVLSILFGGWYEKILMKVKKKKNLAAAITVTSIVLIVIIPVGLLSFAVISEAIGIIGEVQSEAFDLKGRLSTAQKSINPYLSRFGINAINIENSINKFSVEMSREIGERIIGLSQNIFGTLVQIAVMIYVVFFFLRDGRKIIALIIKNFPMANSIEYRLINRFQNVAKATVKGSLLIAILQGILGGILFLLVGVNGAILWGTLMILASLLPIGGTIIWGPIGVLFLLQGQYGKGIIVLLVGGLLIGLLDNLLRPRMVGNETKLPDYLILLSTLGGITCFGLTGFVLGPVIAALFITCWQMMGEIYAVDTNHQNIT
jgi:predicted PurR-regulated permease PerM